MKTASTTAVDRDYWFSSSHGESRQVEWDTHGYWSLGSAHTDAELGILLDRAREIVAGDRKARTARFVRVRGSDRNIKEASLTRAQSLVELKGYVTNAPTTVMPAPEVIAKYHDLWHVEKSFRMSKTDLAARPMFNRMRDAIEAHLTIVFAALAVSHAIQSRTGISIAKVVKMLRPLRHATININGATQTFPPDIPDAERKILTDLGFKPGY